jgi:hypothetical protein
MKFISSIFRRLFRRRQSIVAPKPPMFVNNVQSFRILPRLPEAPANAEAQPVNDQSVNNLLVAALLLDSMSHAERTAPEAPSAPDTNVPLERDSSPVCDCSPSPACDPSPSYDSSPAPSCDPSPSYDCGSSSFDSGSSSCGGCDCGGGF